MSQLESQPLRPAVVLPRPLMPHGGRKPRPQRPEPFDRHQQRRTSSAARVMANPPYGGRPGDSPKPKSSGPAQPPAPGNGQHYPGRGRLNKAFERGVKDGLRSKPQHCPYKNRYLIKAYSGGLAKAHEQPA